MYKYIRIEKYIYKHIIISYIFLPIFYLALIYLFNVSDSEIYFSLKDLDVSSIIVLFVLAPATALILITLEAIFVLGLFWAGGLYIFALLKVISATIISWLISCLIFYGIKNWLLRKTVSEYYKGKISDILGKARNFIYFLNDRYPTKTGILMVGVIYIVLHLSQKRFLKRTDLQMVYYTSFFLMGIAAIRFDKSLMSELKWCFYWAVFWAFIYLICIPIFGHQHWAGYGFKNKESIIVIQSSFLSLIISFVYVFSTWNITERFSNNAFILNVFYYFQCSTYLILFLLVIGLPGKDFMGPNFLKWLRDIGGFIHFHYTKLMVIVIIGGGLIVFWSSLFQEKREFDE